MDDPLVLARAVHLLATMLVTGIVVFDALVAEPALVGEGRALARMRGRSRVLLLGGLMVALLSGAAWFVVLAARIGDTSSLGETAATLAMQTQFGAAWTLRLALALMIAADLAWPGHSASAPRRRRTFVVAASAGFAGTLAWS